jgi:N-acetylneuraminic acid mutarotase
MKRFHISIFLIAVAIITLSSCSSTSVNPLQDGNWVYIGDFGGTARTSAMSFVIGNYAYAGTGIDERNNRYNDLWRFDPSGLFWEQMATCSNAVARNGAVGFETGGMGYMGTGTDGYNYYADFWQYNPNSNSWAQVASMGDSAIGLEARFHAVAFGIDAYGFGYVGTGNDGLNQLNDFWQYNPVSNSWSQIPTYPGAKREQAVTFVYQNKGYLVTGLGTGGTTLNDFFYYDPSKPDTSAWTELRHISNYSPLSYDDSYTTIVRYGAVGFVMLNTTSDGGGDRAFVTTGSVGNITWAYDFATDLWNQKTSFERAARLSAVAFTVENRGFVGLGSAGGTTTTCYANIDEWYPDEPYNAQD